MGAIAATVLAVIWLAAFRKLLEKQQASVAAPEVSVTRFELMFNLSPPSWLHQVKIIEG